MMYADKAHDSPEEVAFRAELAKELNIDPKQLELFGYNKPSRKGANPLSLPNAIRDRIKSYGIDVEAIMHRAYNRALSATHVAPTPQVPKPIAVPKPASASKPNPTQPAEGTKAVLNGKPVVRQNGRWVAAPAAPKPAAKPTAIPATAARKPGTASVKDQLKTTAPKAPPPKATTVLPSQAKPKPKPKPPAKPAARPRGTAGVQLLINDAPSTERYGPGGMFGTVDQLHERQFQWRR